MKKKKPKTLDSIENFREIIELIPIIQKASREGIKKDLDSHEHNEQRLKLERRFLKEGLEIFQKKWALDLLYVLQFSKKIHFNEIKRTIPEISSKTLSNRLKNFENLQIITREVQIVRPIRVVYELTNFGEGIIELLLPFIFYMVLPKKFLINQK